MVKGVVFGKFYPPHLGHKYLIDSALKQADILTVVVTVKKGQKIPGSLRAKWLAEMHPDVRVKLLHYTIADDDDEAWAAGTKGWIGYKPDVVFTSAEGWGDHYARLLGARHIVIDQGRKKFPVSGTMIRKNPQQYLEFLPQTVRGYFEEKIRKFGQEYKIEEKIL